MISNFARKRCPKVKTLLRAYRQQPFSEASTIVTKTLGILPLVKPLERFCRSKNPYPDRRGSLSLGFATVTAQQAAANMSSDERQLNLKLVCVEGFNPSWSLVWALRATGVWDPVGGRTV